MTQRDTQGRFASAQQSINDERFTINFESLNFKRTAIEMAISMLYGYALGCAFHWAAGAMLLLGMPMFLNFAIWFVLFAITCAVVYKTTPIVTNFLYETGASVITTTCEGVVRVKDFVVKRVNPEVSFFSRVKRAVAAF